jgi:DNA polymerase epsilon subunit 3
MLVLFCSANNFALKSKRKTLSGGDVFSALQDMEFEEFIPELKDCLEGNTLKLPFPTVILLMLP